MGVSRLPRRTAPDRGRFRRTRNTGTAEESRDIAPLATDRLCTCGNPRRTVDRPLVSSRSLSLRCYTAALAAQPRCIETRMVHHRRSYTIDDGLGCVRVETKRHMSEEGYL